MCAKSNHARAEELIASCEGLLGVGVVTEVRPRAGHVCAGWDPQLASISVDELIMMATAKMVCS